MAEEENRELVLRLYRHAKRSRSDDDKISSDVHRWAGSLRKEKVGALPTAPPDSHPYPSDGPPPFLTRFRMMDEQIWKALELIQARSE